MKIIKRMALLLSLFFCFSASGCGDLLSGGYKPGESGNAGNGTQTEGSAEGVGSQDNTGGDTQTGTSDGTQTGTVAGGTGSSDGDTVYEVTYYEDGQQVSVLSVDAGETATNLTREDKGFYDFDGWCTDSACTNFYDFTRPVQSNLSLYASYRLNYVELTEEVTSVSMKGMVTVYSQYITSTWESKTSLGGGVIYALKSGVYYLLTNNHVVSSVKEATEAGRAGSYTVHDYGGIEYAGTLVASDSDYDLAVIKFSMKSNRALGVFSFADANPAVGDDVVALGSPLGQYNALTYGKVLGYANCKVNDTTSTIPFQCVKHDAWITNGSSGGALLNTDLEIVGVNFAVSETDAGEHVYSWTVPLLKVKEYLSVNGL